MGKTIFAEVVISLAIILAGCETTSERVDPIAVLNNKQSGVRARGNAVFMLWLTADPRAVEPLIAALKDEDENVRSGAAGALGRIRDPRAVEPLIAALKDEDENVRGNAAGALGRIRDPRAVEPLISALKDEYHRARKAAAEALGNIGDPRAVEPLITALKDEDENVRRNAAGALGKIGDPRAVSAYDAWKKERAKMAQMKQPKYNRRMEVSLRAGQEFDLIAGMDLSRFFSGLRVAIFLEEPMTVVCQPGEAYAINRDGLAVPAAVFHAKTAGGNPAMVSFNSYGPPRLVIRWKE